MPDDETGALYQQMILDHARERHGAGLADEAAVAVTNHQINPTCGDEVTIQLEVDGDLIADVHWDGVGCSISQASASMLHDVVRGLTTAQARARLDAFRTMLRSRGADEGDADLLDDAVALAGVARYPARVKCAMLGWVALEVALEELAA